MRYGAPGYPRFRHVQFIVPCSPCYQRVRYKRGAWVRIKRGLYKDDLARIVDVKTNNKVRPHRCLDPLIFIILFEIRPVMPQVVVKLIPRLDLHRLGLPPDQAKRAGRGIRPPKRFFDVQEVADITGRRVDIAQRPCPFYSK